MNAPDLHASAGESPRPAGGSGDAAVALAARLAAVRARIAAAAQRAGRDEAEVTLVAVSKFVDVSVIAAAAAQGQRDFGESRAQELGRKVTAAAGAGARGIRWHFVGRLQRNKVADVVGRVVLIHSVDRAELADAIAARAQRLGYEQQVLVQVNVEEDPAKGGCRPEEAPALVARLASQEGVQCVGLMTLPTFGADPRPAFRTLRTIGRDVASRFPRVSHLSMGMSNDFEVAVEEGATIVRVGEAIFGPRPVPPI